MQTNQTLEELRRCLAPGIQVLRQLGAGGMGTVFLGRDPALKRSVAIKVLAPDLAQDPLARARFRREAEAAAALSHPNVVSVYQVGTMGQSGVPYLVMQFVEGHTLQDVLAQGGALPEPRVRHIVGEVASALEAAHARALVHRDIKPGNIMLEEETGRAVVLDFGISAVLERSAAPGAEKLTASGASIGTPMYMSPEQAAGAQVSDRSDIYSLGAVAFEVATGRPPFIESSVMGLIAAHLKEKAPDVRSMRGDLEPQLADLINRCLVKEAGERPSAAAIARMLLASGATVVEWPPPGLDGLRAQGSGVVRALGLVGALGLLLLVHLLTQPSTSMLCCWNRPEQSALWNGVKALARGALPVRPDDTDTLYIWTLELGVIVFAASVLALVGIVRAWRLAGRLGPARRSGYPWSVLFDVACDSRSDTAALLNRTGPYAFVSDQLRDRLVRLRRARHAAGVAVSTYALAAPWLWFGWATAHPGAAAAGTTLASNAEVSLVLLPAAVGLAALWALGRPEARLRRRGRRGRWLSGGGSPAPVRAELVAGWLDSLGRGTPRRPRSVPRVLLWVVPTIVVLAGTFMLAVLGTAIGLEVVITGNERTSAASWVAEHTVDSLRPMSWRSIDSLVASSGRVRAGAEVDLEAARLLAAIWARDARANLPAAWDLDTTGSGRWSDDESRIRLWRRLASSGPLPALWPYRARFPSVANVWVLPRASDDAGPSALLRGARELAERNQAAGVLALARGDGSAALLRVRENIAVARQFLRAPLVAQSLAGATIITSAAKAMAVIGRRTRDAALVVETHDLGEAMAALRGELVESWRRDRLLMADPASLPGLQFVGDTTLPPAARLQLIAAIIEGACVDVREMSFGVDSRRGAALAAAGRLASDIPRTDEWVDLNRRSLERLRLDPRAAAVEVGGERLLGPWKLYKLVGLAGADARGAYCRSLPQHDF